jgi:hypothetical protein
MDDTLSPHLDYLISQLGLPRRDLPARLESDMLKFRFLCFWANFTQDRAPTIEPHLEKVINESGGIVQIDEYS